MEGVLELDIRVCSGMKIPTLGLQTRMNEDARVF